MTLTYPNQNKIRGYFRGDSEVTPLNLIGDFMGKLQELARHEFKNTWEDVVKECKLKKEGENVLVVCSDVIDKSTAFREMANAFQVFKAALEMGL